MIIYRAINIKNGKVYIGQTIRKLSVRIREHCYVSAGSSKYKRTYFYRAIQKYGKDGFSWDIVDKASSHGELNAKECLWIDHYKATDKGYGYNNKLGGSNGGHLPETCRKIGDAHRGKPRSPETIKKMSLANKGQVPWIKGKKRSLDVRIKISDSQKHRKIDRSIAIRIKEMIHNGDKSADIARLFDIPHHVVYNIKNEASWKAVPWPDGYIKKHGIAKIDIQIAVQIKKMIINGEKNIHIAIKFGVSDCTIASIRTGRAWVNVPWPDGEIPLNQRGGEHNGNSVINRDMAREVKKLITDGVRNCDIERRLGITKSILQGIKHNKTWKDIPWP